MRDRSRARGRCRGPLGQAAIPIAGRLERAKTSCPARVVAPTMIREGRKRPRPHGPRGRTPARGSERAGAIAESRGAGTAGVGDRRSNVTIRAPSGRPRIASSRTGDRGASEAGRAESRADATNHGHRTERARNDARRVAQIEVAVGLRHELPDRARRAARASRPSPSGSVSRSPLRSRRRPVAAASIRPAAKRRRERQTDEPRNLIRRPAPSPASDPAGIIGLNLLRAVALACSPQPVESPASTAGSSSVSITRPRRVRFACAASRLSTDSGAGGFVGRGLLEQLAETDLRLDERPPAGQSAEPLDSRDRRGCRPPGRGRRPPTSSGATSQSSAIRRTVVGVRRDVDRPIRRGSPTRIAAGG